MRPHLAGHSCPSPVPAFPCSQIAWAVLAEGRDVACDAVSVFWEDEVGILWEEVGVRIELVPGIVSWVKTVFGENSSKKNLSLPELPIKKQSSMSLVLFSC